MNEFSDNFHTEIKLRTVFISLALLPGGACTLDGASDYEAEGTAGLQQSADIPALPQPVTNNAVVSVTTTNGEYLISFAGLGEGRTHSDTLDSTWVFDANTREWAEAASLPGGVGRLAAVAAAVGELAYIFGGYSVAEDGTEVSTPWIVRPQRRAATGRRRDHRGPRRTGTADRGRVCGRPDTREGMDRSVHAGAPRQDAPVDSEARRALRAVDALLRHGCVSRAVRDRAGSTAAGRRATATSGRATAECRPAPAGITDPAAAGIVSDAADVPGAGDHRRGRRRRRPVPSARRRDRAARAADLPRR